MRRSQSRNMKGCMIRSLKILLVGSMFDYARIEFNIPLKCFNVKNAGWIQDRKTTDSQQESQNGNLDTEKEQVVIKKSRKKNDSVPAK